MSSSIESSKTMALIGSILLIIGGLGTFTGYVGILSLVGIILLMIGIKGFSQYYQDPAMYDNAYKGIINYIIAAIALIIAFVVGAGSILSFMSFVLIGLGIVGIIVFFVLLVVAWVFYIMAAKRLRATLNDLSQRTGEHSFHTAGTLLYWGSILIIAFGLGAILIFIAWIFSAIGFFQIKTGPAQPPQYQQQYGYTPQPPTPPPTQAATRFCPNCGAQVQTGATFCPSCGKPLPPS
jgi:uncharacterized membrane protein